MIAALREAFNARVGETDYKEFLAELNRRCGTTVEFRVAETPIFLPQGLLQRIAEAGAAMTRLLIGSPKYLESARKSIPRGFCVAGDITHPNFLTADFALVAHQDAAFGERSDTELSGTTDPLLTVANFRGKNLEARLVELQAFPSVYAYQSILNRTYREYFDLPDSLGVYLGTLDEHGFWELLKKTVLGGYTAENVVLTEVDPLHQKTLPDFLLTRERLGISVVDIASLVPIGKKLHYRNEAGALIPIHRIYNRAIADEIIARKIELPFDWTADWEVEWAGHPNWYFLISKYSVPWLSNLRSSSDSLEAEVGSYVPPAVFLNEFLEGGGLEELRKAGVPLPPDADPDAVYEHLLLKPLFSFAGKGIQFAPSRKELLEIAEGERSNFLLQQRMHFVPTIDTPHGLTQAEIRILYLWPDGGELIPAISLVRLGRGKMMGVDHNRNQEWVGGSAAFWR